MFPISGPAFLVVYLALIAAGVLVHTLIRRGLGQRAARQHDMDAATSQLTAGEVGYLQGSWRRAFAARAVALREGSSTAAEWDRKHTDPEARLEAWGLLLDRAQLSALRLWGIAIYGGLLAAGLARVWIGVTRDKPVGFLLLLLLVVAFLLWRVTRRRPVITRLGRRVVAGMTKRYRASVGDTSYAMGYALLGVTVLTPELTAHLRNKGILGAAGGYTADGAFIGCAGHGGSGCNSGGGSGSSGGGGGCGGCGGSS
jgi:uncharacterized membrane protein YgcG